MSQKDGGFKEFVLEQLAGLEGVSARSMFGGWGLYQEKKFFGIISDGRLYFKTDDITRGEYEAHGMRPFQPSPKQTLKNYYEVPLDILDNPEALKEWAEKATRS